MTLTETMRAATFRGPGQALAIEKLPVPTPGPGEVLVRVAACGLCHTDLHYVDHGVPTAKPPPLVLGHEISGTVAALGRDAVGWREGDRVLVPAVVACGRCAACRTGRENVCADMRMFGNHVDGGFAEFVAAPARDLARVPPEIDLVAASVIADAVTTPYHAVTHRAAVRPGEWTVVVGCGGVGIHAVQIAAAAGGLVVALDVSDAKLDVARTLGAVETVNPASVPDAAREVRRITGGGADVALEVVGTPATQNLALATLRRGGRLCVVGYSERPTEVPLGKVMFHELAIVGSLGCRPADYPRAIELVRRGRVRLEPTITRRVPLARIGEALDALRRGDGFRSVIVP